MKETITVSITTETSIDKIWELWTNPKHITNWNHASDDWHTPKATNDLRTGGSFSFTMAAKDGSVQFDFGGTYDEVKIYQLISYTMDDSRKATVQFTTDGKNSTLTETFEAESTHTIEQQREGWQAILNNFKKYAEDYFHIENLSFEIMIDCHAEVVYDMMLDENVYKEWTAVFNPTSHFAGNWKKGSRMRFLGINSEGKAEGMVGLIEENIPNEFISIKYIGLIQEEKEITEGIEVEGWVGAYEKYFFIKKNDRTLLKVSLDSNGVFKNYFLETYPKALEKLKLICER